MRKGITGKAGCAAAAGILMATGAGAAPALAGTTATPVPCSAAALSDALARAASGATLSLAAKCTYVLTHALPTVAESLSITGNGATLERSRALGTPAFTILTVKAGTASISDLSFLNGERAITVTGTGQLAVTGGTFAGNHATYGGAIFSNNPGYAPTLTEVTFTGNTATNAGGAIYDYNAGASATIDQCTFTGNSAGSTAGAFFEYGIGFGQIINSVFRANTAKNGGAMALSEDEELLLSGVVIEGNKATDDGGGIYSVPGSAGFYAEISTISRNKAGRQGGGIYSGAMPAELVDSKVTDNTAAEGGGIYDGHDALLRINGGTISGNYATVRGGGLYGVGGPLPESSAVIAESTTISGNVAGSTGGGLYNQGSAYASFTGSRIAGNTAPGGGGGIYNSTNGTVALDNTSVTGNDPDNCKPPGSVTGCTG
jgi:predicted outer membrane repeat protein